MPKHALAGVVGWSKILAALLLAAPAHAQSTRVLSALMDAELIQVTLRERSDTVWYDVKLKVIGDCLGYRLKAQSATAAPSTFEGVTAIRLLPSGPEPKAWVAVSPAELGAIKACGRK